MSTLPGETAATFAATLVDEWARAGLRHAVVAPGSRSTPLALALSADPRFEVHVRLDERSAGFVALGIGAATGLPAVLVTTSGTAAAEVHAAVVEAHHAAVPLLVCTADRPPELHGVGAPQTIEQAGLFAGAVRALIEPGVPTEEGRSAWRSIGARAVADAVANPRGPGPVHLNLAFREPLTGPLGLLPLGREGGRPFHLVAPARRSLGDSARALLAEAVGAARRPVLVAGGRAGRPSLLAETAAHLGWPLIADPRSGARRVTAAAPVVTAADALLRSEAFASGHRPDLIVRLGEPWASKVLGAFCSDAAAAGVPVLLVDPFGEWRDPARDATVVLGADPDEVLLELGRLAGSCRAEAGWAERWRSAEHRAQAAIDGELAALGATGALCEPLVARRLAATAAIGAIVVSSSMPVRDLEWYSAAGDEYPLVYSNRGANGIDGVVSTAVGVAEGLAGAAGPVVGLVGDLAFLHDLTALVRPRTSRSLAGHALGLVVVDNAGGGIFSHLPQATAIEPDRFEQLFGTEQGVDPATLATAAGLEVEVVAAPGELDGGLSWLVARLAAGEPAALVCRTSRARGVAERARLHDAVGRAIAG